MGDTPSLQTPSSHRRAAAQSGTREGAPLPPASKQVPSISLGLEEVDSASHPHDTRGPPSHFWAVPHPVVLPTLLHGAPRPEALDTGLRIPFLEDSGPPGKAVGSDLTVSSLAAGAEGPREAHPRGVGYVQVSDALRVALAQAEPRREPASVWLSGPRCLLVSRRCGFYLEAAPWPPTSPPATSPGLGSASSSRRASCRPGGAGRWPPSCGLCRVSVVLWLWGSLGGHRPLSGTSVSPSG